MTPKKKLIEVALPLEAINKAAAHGRSRSGTGTRRRRGRFIELGQEPR